MMFKAGDVVQLKSGGPLMTVTNVSREEDDKMFGQQQTAWVTWFDAHAQVCSSNFKSNLLEEVK